MISIFYFIESGTTSEGSVQENEASRDNNGAIASVHFEISTKTTTYIKSSEKY
jgi:hypothetical protein